MKIKTSELTGPALDWAVAQCEQNVGWKPDGEGRDYYSTEWTQGGPIIEVHEISLSILPDGFHPEEWEGCNEGDKWCADLTLETDEEIIIQASGPSPLIAACRAFVMSRLGPEVEVPDGLV
jgi:hypothetical protein